MTIKSPIVLNASNNASSSSSNLSSNLNFNVRDINGLQAWFDTSNAESISSANSLVSQLNDLSGNANHLVQLTGTSQPTFNGYGGANGLPYISFTNGKNLLKSSFTLSQPYTVYLVIRQNTIVDEGYILKFASAASNGICQKVEVTGSRYAALTMVSQTNFVPVSTPNNYYKSDAFALYSMTFSPGSSNITINKEPRIKEFYDGFTSGSVGISQLQLGLNLAFDFHELLIYSGIVNDTNDLQIKNYLTDKYSLVNYDYIQFYGDSITVGGNSSNYGWTSYAPLIAKETGKNCYNYGVSGHTYYNLSSKIRRSLAANTGWVCIMYGTNGIDATISKEILRASIKMLLKNGTQAKKIIIVTPPYSNSRAATLPALNSKLLEVSQEFNTSFADVFTATMNGGGESLLDDGTHPTDAGHRIIADTIKAVIV